MNETTCEERDVIEIHYSVAAVLRAVNVFSVSRSKPCEKIIVEQQLNYYPGESKILLTGEVNSLKSVLFLKLQDYGKIACSQNESELPFVERKLLIAQTKRMRQNLAKVDEIRRCMNLSNYDIEEEFSEIEMNLALTKKLGDQLQEELSYLRDIMVTPRISQQLSIMSLHQYIRIITVLNLKGQLKFILSNLTTLKKKHNFIYIIKYLRAEAFREHIKKCVKPVKFYTRSIKPHYARPRPPTAPLAPPIW